METLLRTSPLHAGVFFVSLLCSGPSVVSAEEAPHIPFMSRGVKSSQLIEALKPRGITTVSPQLGTIGEKTKPQQCKKRRTRGIGKATEPVALAAVGIEVLFATGSAELTPKAKQTLCELGKALVSEDLKKYSFAIEGHTDSDGTSQYNQGLSESRAQSAVEHLAKHCGVARDRLVLVACGEEDPIADNSTAAGKRKNRRVQVVNLGG